MVHNQLFRKMPDKVLIDQILISFNIDNLQDNRIFSRNELEKYNTVSKINDLKPLLSEYYIPCKGRAYLNDLNNKNIITILRQCIKTFGYKLKSKEKYIKNKKYLYYSIIPIDTSVTRDLEKCKDNKCVVTFS